MQKIWTQSYPPGVPAEIDIDQYPDLITLFTHAADEFNNHTAYTSFGTELSYKKLFTLSRAFAAYLQQELKLEQGVRIAIMLPNLLQYPVALLGAMEAGLTVVNLNPLYTPPEIERQLNDSGATAIVVLANAMHNLELALPKTQIRHVIVTEVGDLLDGFKGPLINLYLKYIKRVIPKWQINTVSLPTVLAKGADLTLQPVKIKPDDVALLQYTGGTTGTPKGAELTHRNLVANVLQSVAWVKPILELGNEMVLVALPLYHIFSLTVCCFSFLSLGANGLLITDPRNLKSLIKSLNKYPVSIFVGLNTLFHGLLARADFKSSAKRYKLTIAGGMPTHAEVAHQWQQVTGCMILEGYGLTETSPIVSINPTNLSEFNHSIGLPIPNTEVLLRDDNGQAVAIGEVGELCIRGPQVMKGYWHNDNETHKVIDNEGWLATGDLARMDSKGFLYIVGRKKDMILVSGFNVYPNDIEDVIAAYPKVAEVAVIGVDDAATGEAVKAFVVKKEASLSKNELIAYCYQHLTGYKVPKYIEFRDSLPKSNVGKVLHRLLREENDTVRPAA